MKNKLNKFLKSIIISIAFVFGISLFAVSGITATTFAATVGEWHYADQKKTQTAELSISSVPGSQTLYLYSNNNGIGSIADCFSYFNTNDEDDTESTATELIHHEKTTWTPSAVLPHNGQFSSVITLSNNIMLALYSGNISISAQAQTSSWKNGTNWGVQDKADYVKTSIFAYSAADNTNYVSNETANNAKEDYSLDSVALESSSLKDLLYNRIELVFKNTLNGVSRNYMKVKEPQVTFSTSDTTKPVISGFDNVSTAWVKERIIPVTFEDAESGIHKIEMQTNGGEWVEVANFVDCDTPTYTTSYTYDLVVTENNSAYKFRVTDNVGNVEEMTEAFVEEHIDTVAPEVAVSLPETFGSLKIDFASVVTASALSNDTFTYTLKDATENVISTGALADAVSLDVTTDGTYIIEVVGVDEAGNTFVWSGQTTVQRTVVSVNITDTYTYSTAGFNLEYAPSIEGDYEIVWTYLTEDESATVSKIENVGTYVVTYSIDAFEFVGSGKKTIYYDPKLVELGSIKTEYVYGEAFAYTLLDTQDANANLVVNFKLDGVASAFENVGTYEYEIVRTNTNYSLAETKGTATISPKVVTATISNTEAVYDKTAKALTVVLSEDLEYVCEYSVGGVSADEPINAGTYDAVITLKENNPNYAFEAVSTSLVIKKATLNVFANENQSKVYGEEDPTFTYTVYGLYPNDELVGELAREQGEGVGYYNITLNTLESANYNITFTSSVFSIEKRNLILIALSTGKTYGQDDPKFTFNSSIAKILDGDKEAFETANVFVREEGNNVGKYTISLNEEILNVSPFKNYRILSSSANFVISKATLKVEAHNVTAIYGNEEELEKTVTGLAYGDQLDIQLEREQGDVVGDYQITLKNDKFDNYVVEFVSGTYTIIAREIEVVAKDVTKVYGNNETLEFDVVNAVDSGVVLVSRQPGENVGEHNIDAYEVLNSNYVVVNFTPAKLYITKAEISVVVGDAEKVYGEADPTFIYQVSGLKFDDQIEFETIREAGENVGEYEISIAETELDNYIIADIETATLVVSKATPTIEIEDKNFIYSASPISYVAECEFELSYTYYFAGNEIDAPTNAGEYTVVAHFAGNDNYNAVSSNEANVVINKKFIPITLKKLTFLYTGKGQVPEYEIGIDTNVSVLTIFEGGSMPVEVGEYPFSMVSNDPNYYASTIGVLKIVEVLYVQDTQNSASVSSTSVSATNASVKILNNTGSSLLKKFNPLFDGRKCEAVYEFANAGAKTNGEVFSVRIKALDTENPVEIFAVSANGEMVKTAYTIVDGYYVFSLNSLSNQIMVTTTNNMMFYVRIATMVAIFFMTIIITKSVKRRNLNHFLKRNTTVKKFKKDELRENIGIVNERVEVADRISAESFMNVRKTKTKAKNGA